MTHDCDDGDDDDDGDDGDECDGDDDNNDDDNDDNDAGGGGGAADDDDDGDDDADADADADAVHNIPAQRFFLPWEFLECRVHGRLHYKHAHLPVRHCEDRGMDCQLPVVNQLFHALGKLGDVDRLKELLESRTRHQREVTGSMYNALISAYAKRGGCWRCWTCWGGLSRSCDFECGTGLTWWLPETRSHEVSCEGLWNESFVECT